MKRDNRILIMDAHLRGADSEDREICGIRVLSTQGEDLMGTSDVCVGIRVAGGPGIYSSYGEIWDGADQ